MSKVRIVLEAAKGVHPMAVHAYPSGKNEFTVHATGSKVKHVKKGDKVTSSDLDDLSDAGHKVKEVKKPISEAKGEWHKDMAKAQSYAKKKLTDKAKAARDAAHEAGEPKKKVTEGHSGYGYAADAHFKTLSKKQQDAVNLHLRKGKSYDDAVKAAKVHVKEEEEIDEGKDGSGGYRMKDGTYVPYKSYEKAGQEARAKRAESGRALADADKATRARAKANEEIEQVDEKLTPEAKSAIKQALGPRTPGNQMRKSSGAARTLISVLKTNKKNTVPGTK